MNAQDYDDNDAGKDSGEYDGPSRSQLKRESEALQVLGEELIELSVDTIKKFDLPDNLKVALLDAKKITANGAIRRQRQYIGKLMRSVEVEPIEAQLRILKGENDQHTAWLHRIERWRDKLVADDGALDDLMDDFQVPDIQALRQAIRNARREKAENKPPKSYRIIFQTLKGMIPEPGKPVNDAYAAPEGDDDE